VRIVNSMFSILVISLTLSPPTCGSPVDGQHTNWPCGELPKLLRNQKGEPVWLTSTQLSRRVVNRVEPTLPSSLRLQGNIIADVLVGADGSVRCTRVRKGHPILRRAVEEAVKQWTFKPTTVKGEPVAVFGFIKFHFSN
jgi:TonB-like protein